MYTTLLGCPLPLVLGWFSAGSASAAWDLGARFPMVCGCLFYERGGCPGFFVMKAACGTSSWCACELPPLLRSAKHGRLGRRAGPHQTRLLQVRAYQTCGTGEQTSQFGTAPMLLVSRHVKSCSSVGQP